MEALKTDSEYFVNKLQSKDANFDPKNMEANMTEPQREIRWHCNAINLFNVIIDENLSLRNQIQVMQESIEDLTKNWALSEQRLSAEIYNLRAERDFMPEPIGESSRINPNIKLTVPTFDPKTNFHPMQFLMNLHNYLQAAGVTDRDLKVIFSQAMQGSAKQWYYGVEEFIVNFEDFEENFRDRYWNEPIKQKLRIRLETGLYDADGSKSRVSHAEELLAIAKELKINLSDADLILTIGRQFEFVIQQTIRMQSIKKFGHLYDLLQEYDNQDLWRRARKNNTKNQNKKPWQKKSDNLQENVESKKANEDQSQATTNNQNTDNGGYLNNNNRNGGGYKPFNNNRSFKKSNNQRLNNEQGYRNGQMSQKSDGPRIASIEVTKQGQNSLPLENTPPQVLSENQ